ncbi:hypothetical protein NPIL_282201 [Nephila pilipes]|uniref:Uncharacterized protein n=1 Tax=Nephila pilipes TaxID=299642 RepID=A0A8X6QE48_NEPPI|nr:hypothetical protein NPIL_282201 [Nephila pilipes]
MKPLTSSICYRPPNNKIKLEEFRGTAHGYQIYQVTSNSLNKIGELYNRAAHIAGVGWNPKAFVLFAGQPHAIVKTN